MSLQFLPVFLQINLSVQISKNKGKIHSGRAAHNQESNASSYKGSQVGVALFLHFHTLLNNKLINQSIIFSSTRWQPSTPFPQTYLLAELSCLIQC